VVRDPADIRYDYDLGGGALMDGGCYAIDFMRLFGEPSVTGALADDTGFVDRAMAVRLAFADGGTGWFDSAFTRDGEFRGGAHVICADGHVWLSDFIFPHRARLVATRDGQVVADEQGGGDTTYVWQLRAFASAVFDGSPVDTSAAHGVTTMRLIDAAYRAAGLPPRC
jgi:predicted dehydrogenase